MAVESEKETIYFKSMTSVFPIQTHRCALQDYVDVNVKVEQNKTFSFAVPYNDVRKHLEDSTPCTWKLEAAGSNTNGKVSTTWHSYQLTFDWMVHLCSNP